METECHYNWDDLEVGTFDLDHSEQFFERKHIKHEKLNYEISDLLLTMEEKENNKNSTNRHPKSNNNKENVLEENRSGKIPPNLVAQLPAAQTTITKNKLEVPSAYKYWEIYDKKKNNMIQELLQQERKNRIFHSRPVPNFAALHKQNEKKQKENELPKIIVTTPVTPLVLKKSKEMEEKKQQIIDEYNKKNKPRKFISRNPHVLHEEPFKPKKCVQVLESQPFNLHVEKRLHERKQFDENIKKSLEEKIKQEEEQRKRQEEELVRELRKLASFKARPNPFK